MKNKNKKKVTQSVSKRVLKNLHLGQRVATLESQFKELVESKRTEAHFQAGLVFGVNGLVEALVEKEIITVDEIESARTKVMIDYHKERAEQQRIDEVKKKHNNNPVHYDSTVDKWYVFSPNWEDKVGPFLTEDAANEAKRQIEEPTPVATPVPTDLPEDVTDIATAP